MAILQKPKLRDPITFEVVKNGLLSLADEMGIAIVRTAHCQMIRDAMDFSTAICDARGRVIAQGIGVPALLGAMPDGLQAVLRKFEGDIHPGDVFVLNDPDEGGMHLPDVFIFKPVFSGETLVGFSGVVAHHQDVGGRVPGGNAVDSTEIFQEGLQIPPLKLFERGRPNSSLLAVWLRNVRIPDIVYGDIQAQVAACHVGEQGLLRLAGRYGTSGLQRLMDEILDYTEWRVRTEVRQMPDGVYHFEDHIDDDGFGSGPIAINVNLVIEGDDVRVSFAGTSPQVRAALNGTRSFAKSTVYVAFKCVTSPDIPANDGFYRPISVEAPEGSILNPVRPAARAARGLTGFRTIDAVLGALAAAVPDRVLAAGEGGATMVTLGGLLASRKPFVCVDAYCGGWGARPDRDGVDGTSHLGTNVANVPIEEIELRQPVRVEQYAFLPDSAGPGRFRGCLSIVRDLRLLAEDATLQIRSDRRRFLPYGLAGGGSGSPSLNVLNPGRDERLLPTTVTMAIAKNDVVRHVTAGGGGHGDAFERDSDQVLAEVLDGKVSVTGARETYGVVIEDGAVDQAKTASLRADRMPFDGGRSRSDRA
jgi:N-methylhydantoinase B